MRRRAEQCTHNQHPERFARWKLPGISSCNKTTNLYKWLLLRIVESTCIAFQSEKLKIIYIIRETCVIPFQRFVPKFNLTCWCVQFFLHIVVLFLFLPQKSFASCQLQQTTNDACKTHGNYDDGILTTTELPKYQRIVSV